MRYTLSLSRLLTADFGDQAQIKSRLQSLTRAVYAVVRDLAKGQLSLRSTSLSFTTLLSLVPMLALSFSILKGFGVHNFLEPVLQDFLAPMGEGAEEVSGNILSFVENMNVAVLGSAGLMVLIFTVVSLVRKVENSFNYIWGVKQGRGFIDSLRDYLSIILVGPMMAVSAAGIATTLQQSDLVLRLQDMHPLGSVLVDVLRMMPKLIVFAIFTFLYAFIPNIRVQWYAAAMGALVAAILWLVAGWAFTSFVASSAKYTAIYSSFAVLILLMIWLNLNWLFVLMGANIAYYVQNPDQLLLARGEMRPSARIRERVAMQTMIYIAMDYEQGEVCWSGDRLRRAMQIPREVVNMVLRDLAAAGLVVETLGKRPPCYLPGRACDHIQLEDILRAVNAAGHQFGGEHAWADAVRGVFSEIDQSTRQSLGGRTLADLVRAQVANTQGPGTALT